MLEAAHPIGSRHILLNFGSNSFFYTSNPIKRKEMTTGRANSKNKIGAVGTCQDATNLILEFLSGELSPESNSEFEKHLQVCPDCVAFLNTYRKTIELTKRFLHKE